jgi:hypothetical protein
MRLGGFEPPTRGLEAGRFVRQGTPRYVATRSLGRKQEIGRAKARDHTSGSPVTTFKRSDRLYRIAMSYHRGLDRDHDGIA